MKTHLREPDIEKHPKHRIYRYSPKDIFVYQPKVNKQHKGEPLNKTFYKQNVLFYGLPRTYISYTVWYLFVHVQRSTDQILALSDGNILKYGVAHKIIHLACEGDFYVFRNHMYNTYNKWLIASYTIPLTIGIMQIRHFRAIYVLFVWKRRFRMISKFLRNIRWIEIHQYISRKQSVLFYRHPRSTSFFWKFEFETFFGKMSSLTQIVREKCVASNFIRSRHCTEKMFYNWIFDENPT